MLVYLWFPKLLKVEWEAKLSRYGRLTPSLLLTLDLKPSTLRKLIVSNSVVTVTVLVRLIIFRV